MAPTQPQLISGRSPVHILCFNHTKLTSILQLCLPKAPFLEVMFMDYFSSIYDLMMASLAPGSAGFHWADLSLSFSPYLGGYFIQEAFPHL